MCDKQWKPGEKSWVEGITAFEHGLSRDDNPHKDEPFEASQWMSGYLMAEMMLRTCHVGTA